MTFAMFGVCCTTESNDYPSCIFILFFSVVSLAGGWRLCGGGLRVCPGVHSYQWHWCLWGFVFVWKDYWLQCQLLPSIPLLLTPIIGSTNFFNTFNQYAFDTCHGNKINNNSGSLAQSKIISLTLIFFAMGVFFTHNILTLLSKGWWGFFNHNHWIITCCCDVSIINIITKTFYKGKFISISNLFISSFNSFII